MSTSYDPTPPATAIEEEGPQHYDLSSPEPETTGNGALSTLEQLRTAAETAEKIADVEFADCQLYSPGRVIRLTCSTELDNAEWKKLQLRALPPEQRRKRNPDLRKLDEGLALAYLIARQTTAVALRQHDSSVYKVIEERGDVLTFTDPQLLAVLGAADSAVAVKAVFGGYDAYVLDAGKELLDACGFGDRRPGEDDDQLDPH